MLRDTLELQIGREVSHRIESIASYSQVEINKGNKHANYGKMAQTHDFSPN